MKGEKAIPPTLKRRGFPRRFFMIALDNGELIAISKDELFVNLEMYESPKELDWQLMYDVAIANLLRTKEELKIYDRELN